MAERPALLSEAPQASAPDMRDLIGIAAAIEAEAVRRYAELAQEMARRGEHETAATFRQMVAIEARHVEAVDHWAESLNEPVPPPQEFVWRLPREIAASWDEVRNSSLLSPYRALAIAVTNEERAFALYAYVAAHAADRRVAGEAEAMAREELAHAAELRVLRRQAYRREHGAGLHAHVGPVESVAVFRVLEQRLTQAAADAHEGLARALDSAGDAASAALVEAMARQERDPSAGARLSLPQAGPATGVASAALLRRALQPLERASEIYEDLLAQSPGEALMEAEQTALAAVVERIAVVARRIEETEHAA